MFFGKSYWKSTEDGIRREWLLTNGIGGFSSGTIIGMNARRYHGLLVASLNPPVDRYLILSQISEQIAAGGKDYFLHSFKTHDYTAHGEYHLDAFHYDGIPEFHYRIGTMSIVKKVVLRYGMNQVFVVYRVKNHDEKTILRLTPLVNFRNYHYLSYHQYMTFSTDADGRRIEITPLGMSRKIFVDCSDGKAVLQNQCYFYNMDYPYEHERGLNGTEDHYIPGFYEIELAPGEERTITVACGVDDCPDPSDGEAMIERELSRQKSVIGNAGDDEFLKRLFLAADQFIVHRNSTGAKTVIAGYPWFTDWGRDTMIAFPGLTLSTGRFEDAKEILYTFARYEHGGLIPNVFPDHQGEPAYNTVDAALWYFEAVYKYIQYTNDIAFVKENILPVLQKIIEKYKTGTLFEIHMDRDGLIEAGSEDTQLTWMDAKAGNWVVTPRHGKAVEINALWYNALMVMAGVMEMAGQNGSEYEELAARVKKSFKKVFWNGYAGCLYDVVNEQGEDGSLRPNQIIAVSLSFPVLDGTMARQVVDKVHRELYTALGLRTLSPADPQYRGIYIGDQYARDGAYHQGTVWVWLLGRFITAYARVYRDDPELKSKLEDFFKPFHDHLNDACIGGISEIFDGNEPLLPRGCCSQAWSVSEILRAYTEDYLPLKNK